MTKKTNGCARCHILATEAIRKQASKSVVNIGKFIPKHCHTVRTMEQQATSSFWEQQRILFLAGEQEKASYTPGNKNISVKKTKKTQPQKKLSIEL